LSRLAGDLVQTLENLEMKKTLVALAALAATASFAQSNITIYGNLDQGVYRSTDSGVSTTKIASNVNSTSVLGFRGTEDLGGGISAGFHLLSELSLPEGQVGSSTSGDAAQSGQKTNFFTRAANVSLTDNSIGSFEIGRIQDALWLTQGAFSNTGSNSFGWSALTAQQTNTGSLQTLGFGSTTSTQYSGTTGTGGVANNAQSGSAPINFNAGWGIKTKSFSGLQFTYQHVGNQMQSPSTSTGYTAGQGYAFRVEYTNGPLNVQYAESIRTDSGDIKALKYKTYGATYQLGAAKLVGAQSKLNTDGALSGIHGNTVNGFGVLYDVNAKVNVAAGYTTMKDDVSGDQTKVIGLTGRYNLSKRTQLYAGYGHGTNGPTLKTTVFYGGPASLSTAGASSTGYLVGIRHGF